MDWHGLSEVQRFAARRLFDERDHRLYRACCSRAYYAAYSAVTHRLPATTVHPRGWNNPAHPALPGHVSQMTGLSAARKDAIREALSRLRQRREDSDYRPGVTVDRTAARESLRDLRTVLALLP